MNSHRYNFRSFVVAIAVSFAALLPLTASAEEIFAQLTEMAPNEVESTYISGRWSNHKQIWASQNGRHGIDLSEGFSALYTYNCYSEAAVQKARKILDAYIKKTPDIELLMRNREAGCIYEVYEHFTKENLLKQMIVWSCDAPNVCEIIVVDWVEGLQR